MSGSYDFRQLRYPPRAKTSRARELFSTIAAGYAWWMLFLVYTCFAAAVTLGFVAFGFWSTGQTLLAISTAVWIVPIVWLIFVFGISHVIGLALVKFTAANP